MSTVQGGPGNIVTSGLGIYYDATNPLSYSGSGTVWNDLSKVGNLQQGYVGTLVNGPTFSTSNLGSIVFDGADDFINIPSSPTITNQFTNEIWVNITAVNGVQYIFGREGAYRVIAFYNQPGSPEQLTWVCATTNNSWYSAGTAINYPTTITGWKQIVGVYDGTKNLLYVNGALAVTGSAISGNVLSVGNLTLMSNNGIGLLYGKGNVAIYRQYISSLSASQIFQNFQATRARFGI